jgi:hypothetical protein
MGVTDKPLELARARDPGRFDALRYFFAVEFEAIGHTGPHAAIDALHAAGQVVNLEHARRTHADDPHRVERIERIVIESLVKDGLDAGVLKRIPAA